MKLAFYIGVLGALSLAGAHYDVEPQADLYAEIIQNDNAVVTSITVQDQFEVVDNFSAGALRGWTFTSTGEDRLIAGTAGPGNYEVNYSVSASAATSGANYEFAVSVNDVTECYSEREIPTLDLGNAGSPCIITISSAGDYVKLEVRNRENTNNVTIKDSIVMIHKL